MTLCWSFSWYCNSYFVSCLNTLAIISRKCKITLLLENFQTCKNTFNENTKLGAYAMELFFMWLFIKSPAFHGEPDCHTRTWALTFPFSNWSGQNASFQWKWTWNLSAGLQQRGLFWNSYCCLSVMETTPRADCLNSLPGMNLLFHCTPRGECEIEAERRVCG